MDWSTLQNLSSLQSLTLFSIKKLEDISLTATSANLEILKFIWMGAITKLPDFSKLTKLRDIEFDTCNKLVDVSSLVNVKSLEKVSFVGGKNLTKDAVETLLMNTSIKTPSHKILEAPGKLGWDDFRHAGSGA